MPTTYSSEQNATRLGEQTTGFPWGWVLAAIVVLALACWALFGQSSHNQRYSNLDVPQSGSYNGGSSNLNSGTTGGGSTSDYGAGTGTMGGTSSGTGIGTGSMSGTSSGTGSSSGSSLPSNVYGKSSGAGVGTGVGR